MKKPQLVENARDWPKLWSVRMSVLGGSLVTLAELGPSYVASVWTTLPDAFRDAVPDSVVKYIGIGLVFLSPIARVIKQEKLHAEKSP